MYQLVAIFLLLFTTSLPFDRSGEEIKIKSVKTGFFSLEGKVLPQGNPVDENGNIRKNSSPLLHLAYANTKSPKGTIPLLPGGSYELINLKNEGKAIAGFLNPDGSINHEMMPDWLHPSPAGAKARALAMEPLLSNLVGDKSRDAEILKP